VLYSWREKYKANKLETNLWCGQCSSAIHRSLRTRILKTKYCLCFSLTVHFGQVDYKNQWLKRFYPTFLILKKNKGSLWDHLTVCVSVYSFLIFLFSMRSVLYERKALSRVGVHATNNNGSRSDDWIYWHLLGSITLSCHQYNSYLQATQRYRWFTHFPVHHCTHTRILSHH
jgi:hypothetical protein